MDHLVGKAEGDSTQLGAVGIGSWLFLIPIRPRERAGTLTKHIVGHSRNRSLRPPHLQRHVGHSMSVPFLGCVFVST